MYNTENRYNTGFLFNQILHRQPPGWYTRITHALPIVVNDRLIPLTLLHEAYSIFVDEVLGGEDKLSFRLPWPAPAELMPGALIDFAGKVYRIMIINDIKDDNGTRHIETEAWALWYDLGKMPELSEKRWINASVSEVLDYLLQGTRWSLGNIEVFARRDLSWGGGCNRLEILREMEKIYNAEIKWDTVSRVISVTLVNESDSGMFFLRAKNLRKVNIETSYTDTVHRLYPRGYDGIGIESVNNGLPYIELLNPPEPPLCAVLNVSDITEPQMLKEYALAVFSKMNVPQINYECEVADLSAISGYEDEFVKVGNVVTVFDENSDINVKTRVTRLRYDVVEPWKSGIELSTIKQDISGAFRDASEKIKRDLKHELDALVTTAVVTDTLYADFGYIANLTVSELNTGWKKIENYLNRDASEINYSHHFEQHSQYITASTDGTQTVHISGKQGQPLYWLSDSYKGITTEMTDFPVLSYLYQEAVKFEITFLPTGVKPILLTLGIGAGNPHNPDWGKAFIFKDADGLRIMHLSAINGAERSIYLHDEGIDVVAPVGFTRPRVGGKNIWVQPTAPTAFAVGDIWIQT